MAYSTHCLNYKKNETFVHKNSLKSVSNLANVVITAAQFPLKLVGMHSVQSVPNSIMLVLLVTEYNMNQQDISCNRKSCLIFVHLNAETAGYSAL